MSTRQTLNSRAPEVQRRVSAERANRKARLAARKAHAAQVAAGQELRAQGFKRRSELQGTTYLDPTPAIGHLVQRHPEAKGFVVCQDGTVWINAGSKHALPSCWYRRAN